MHCVMTGATGLVGVSLVNRLVARGDTVTVLSRDPARVNLPARRVVRWDAASPLPDGTLDGADAVVHLAGENIAAAEIEAWLAQLSRPARAGAPHAADKRAAHASPLRQSDASVILPPNEIGSAAFCVRVSCC